MRREVRRLQRAVRLRDRASDRRPARGRTSSRRRARAGLDRLLRASRACFAYSHARCSAATTRTRTCWCVRSAFPDIAAPDYAVVVDLPVDDRVRQAAAARHRRRRRAASRPRIDRSKSQAAAGRAGGRDGQPAAAPTAASLGRPAVTIDSATGRPAPPAALIVPTSQLEHRGASTDRILRRAGIVGDGASDRALLLVAVRRSAAVPDHRGRGADRRPGAGASRSPDRCTSCSPAPSACGRATSRTRSR